MFLTKLDYKFISISMIPSFDPNNQTGRLSTKHSNQIHINTQQ